MLGMLTFRTVIVIHRSNYLSESEMGQPYLKSQYSLYNVDTMKHTIRGQNGTGCAVLPQGRGKTVWFHIF